MRETSPWSLYKKVQDFEKDKENEETIMEDLHVFSEKKAREKIRQKFRTELNELKLILIDDSEVNIDHLITSPDEIINEKVMVENFLTVDSFLQTWDTLPQNLWDEENINRSKLSFKHKETKRFTNLLAQLIDNINLEDDAEKR